VSNLSFQNIARVAATLDVPLSELFSGLESKAQTLKVQNPAARKPKKKP